MAIEFIQTQKRQRYLILILTLVISAILLVVWQGFFREPAPSTTTSLPAVAPSKIEINLEVLKDIKLGELKIFEQVPAFEDEVVGRKDPFTPY